MTAKPIGYELEPRTLTQFDPPYAGKNGVEVSLSPTEQLELRRHPERA